MKPDVRVRFAPSPTGPLHIGGLRTALYNYLFAKKHGGVFVLRIEDTDQNRYVQGAEQYIQDSLAWCHLKPDEGPGTGGGFGPYRQSERLPLYQEHIKTLIQNGSAYYAFDTNEALNQHRQNHEAKGKIFIYNWHNRLKLQNSLSMGLEKAEGLIAEGTPYVIRFKFEVDEPIIVHDIIRGEITIDPKTLDDKILMKNDGYPTYHFANVVDDHLMNISHVIRGEEWVPSLPLHCELFKALGWEAPQYAHLPLILKPNGKGKLSKRDGDKGGFPIFPLQWNDTIGYKESGFVPEAVVNFLAFLGWNPGDEKEIFSLGELTKNFSLERINKSGARFDPEKNKWYNHQWIQKLPESTLVESLKSKLQNHGAVPESLKSDHYLSKVVALVKERVDLLGDFWNHSHFFFLAPPEFDPKAVKKQWKENTAQILDGVISHLKEVKPFVSESLENNLKQFLTDNEIPLGRAMAPIRLSLVGSLSGPSIFDIMETIGKEETINRLIAAVEKLG